MMEDGTIRSGRRKPFVVLYREVAQDGRLSLSARGLFAVMASLPEDWSYTVAGLARVAQCSKYRVRLMLEELEKVGYLVRAQSHGDGGKFGPNTYILQDESPVPLSQNSDNGEAEKAPLSEKTVNGETRQREKPSTENLTLHNKKYTEELNNNPPTPQKGGKRASKYDLAEDAKPILRAYVGKDAELYQALATLIEVRVAKKAVNSARAIKMLLTELDRLSGGRREDKLALVRQSVTNSWKSVFPLRGGGQGQPQPGPTPPKRQRKSHVEIIDGEEVVVFDDSAT